MSLKLLFVLSSLLLLLINAPIGSCANILGLFPKASKSHFILGNKYLRALADAGHNVTMVSPFEDLRPVQNASYRNLVLTDLPETPTLVREMFDLELNNRPYITINFVFTFILKYFQDVMVHPVIQDLIKSEEIYDVVIVSQFFEGLKIFADHFKAHLIVFNNGEPNMGINSIVGNPSPVSYVSHVWLGFASKMTFWQRFQNVCYAWYFDLMMKFYLIPAQNEIVRKYLPNSPPLNEVIYNTSLVLVTSHESLTQTIPLVPVMIPIGGFHVENPKNLSSHLQDLLDNASAGAVYFSMGSSIRSEYMPTNKRKSILRSFGKLKEKVLWKYENDILPERPNNVIISKWFPQNDILAHPNVKVFITHGGHLSITEALYHGVPVIAIPIHTDQRINSINAVENGYGIMLSFKDVSEVTLSAALTEILSNPKYSKAAKMRSEIFRDRPMKPIDSAVWWTEYVIRNNGAKHLRVEGIKLSWFSYYLIDVYSVIIAIILAIIVIIIKLYN